jgi:arginyl-tRNA synthetase
MNVKQKIGSIIKNQIGLEINLVEPKDISFGDYSTSIAFNIAYLSHWYSNLRKSSPIEIFNSLRKASPVETARDLVSQFKFSPDFIDRMEIKDGYINFWVSNIFLYQFLDKILEEGSKFGSSTLGNNKRVLIEFVSANPTGPLVVANGRASAVGDSLVRILNFTGYQVDSEYYVDDSGRQVDLLEQSIKARYDELDGKEAEIPEGGYPGEYIIEIAKQLKERCDLKGKSPTRHYREFGINSIVEMQKRTLERLGVKFTNWVHESSIRAGRGPQKVIDCLKEKGLVYEKDGAVWLKTADNNDKVLVKSTGEFTYRVPDIAYHLDKFNRGYEWLIDLFGPDQSHIPELKFALSICGIPDGTLKVITIQWVTFKRGGKKIGMSKRKGEFVTLDELIDEIGKDAARFFFLTRRLDSHLDFDIELAKSESKDNPVYYVQYACARISSILRVAKDIDFTSVPNLSLLIAPEELLLIRKLVHFPEVVGQASIELSPHYIPFYLLELATLFHNFYEHHKVISEDKQLTLARLTLIKAVRQVISNGLALIGIESPEKM